MLKYPLLNPENELIEFVYNWFELLAQGKIAEACALVDEPDSDGFAWNEDKLVSLLNFNYGPDSIFVKEHPKGPVFTSPTTAQGRHVPIFVEYDDHSGYVVQILIPLNGEWSDLTAMFEFEIRNDMLVVKLDDFQVL